MTFPAESAPAQGPSRLRRAVQARPVLVFYLLSLLMAVALIPLFLFTGWGERLEEGLARTGIELTTTYVTAIRLLAAAPETWPGVLVAVLQPLTPDIAAFAVMAVGFGAAGVWALVRRYRPWRRGLGWRVGTRAWAEAVGVMVAISLATAGLNVLLLPDAQFRWGLDLLSGTFLVSLLVAMFLDAGGVAEETGWRGFVLPIFQARYGAMVGTLLLGVLWALWHVPVKIDLLLDFGGATFAGMMALFVVRLTLLSLVMTYFYNRVGGSTLLAIAMHGLHNDSARLQGRIADAAYDAHWAQVEVAMIVPIGVVAAVLIVATRGRLGLPDAPRDPRPMPAAGLA